MPRPPFLYGVTTWRNNGRDNNYGGHCDDHDEHDGASHINAGRAKTEEFSKERKKEQCRSPQNRFTTLTLGKRTAQHIHTQIPQYSTVQDNVKHPLRCIDIVDTGPSHRGCDPTQG